MSTYDARFMDRLESKFCEAAMFLKDKVQNEGWHWTSNYLREHVRARYGLRFTNTVSPIILRRLRDNHPELRPYIEIGALKDE